MAIPSGSGTEVIKSTEITALTNSVQTLITGVANHIYTVLSIIVCEANDDSGKMVKLYFADSDGSTNPVFLLRSQPVGANETFVFNDKFSYTGGTRKLQIILEASGNMDVRCTYIDQDWS